MYRAAWILLYRIYLPCISPIRVPTPNAIRAESLGKCSLMAIELHHLFELYQKTFRLRHLTYSLGWCMVRSVVGSMLTTVFGGNRECYGVSFG